MIKTLPQAHHRWYYLLSGPLWAASLFLVSPAVAPNTGSLGAAQLSGSTQATGMLAAQAPRYSGLTLGWIVMVLLLAALAYSVYAILKGINSEAGELPVPRWMDFLTPILAIAGLGVALYLTYVETQSVQAICGPIGDCNAVQSSRYATLFGVLPVGLLGAIGYIAILLAWLAGRFASAGLKSLASPAIFTMALLGTIYSAYLTYLELFVIRAVCIWCLTSAVLIALILVFNVRPLINSLNPTEEDLLSA